MFQFGDFGNSGEGIRPWTGGGTTGSKLPGTGGNQFFDNLPTSSGGNPMTKMGISPNEDGGSGPFGGGPFGSGGRPGTYGGGGGGSAPAASPANYIAPYLINLGQGFGTMTPISPSLTSGFMGWLQSQIGQGVPGYGGQLSAGPNDLLQQLTRFYQGGPGNLPGMDTLESLASGRGPGADALNEMMRGGGPGSDLIKSIMGGGGPGGGILSQMAQTGMPTDVGPAWEAMKTAQQRQIDMGAADLKQQFNFGGGLAGSPFGNAISDYYSQSGKDLNSILAQMSVGSQEAARGRQMGAADTLQGRGLQAADILGTRGLNASDILRGTALSAGGAEAQAGLGFQGQAGQIGQLMQSIQQSGLDKQYQEFLRTQPQYNPLLNLMFGGATTFPPILSNTMTKSGQGGGQTAGSILGGTGAILGALAPFL